MTMGNDLQACRMSVLNFYNFGFGSFSEFAPPGAPPGAPGGTPVSADYEADPESRL